MKTPNKPHNLLDAVLKSSGLQTDSQLADKMKVSRAAVCKVRSGKSPASAQFRTALARTFRMSLTRIDELDPPAKEKP